MNESDFIYFDIYFRKNLNNENFLDQIKLDILKLFNEETKDYILNNNEIIFEIKPKDNLIHCKYNHNGCIDDEYFIVNLILLLTVTRNDLTVRIYDNDGEFVLIDSLNNNDNINYNNLTTFVYLGNLIPVTDNDLFIKNFHDNTNPGIMYSISDNDLISNLNNYCSYRINKLKENNIYYNIFLPKYIGFLLIKFPSLLTSIVDKLESDDSIIKNKFNSEIMMFKNKLVKIRIKLTKNVFVRLFSANLMPPRRSLWLGGISENSRLSVIFGYRIIYGFLLLKQHLNPSNTSPFNSDKFSFFLKNLEKFDFFQGEILGSEKYKNLLNIAKSYFINIEKSQNNSTFKFNAISNIFDNLNNNFDENYDDNLNNFINENSDINFYEYLVDNDDESTDDISWLEDYYKDAEKNIVKKYDDENIKAFGDSKLQKFTDTKSSVLDGVEFYDPEINKNIDIDPEAIEKSINRLLDDFENLGKNSDESESEYDSESIQQMNELMEQMGKDLKDEEFTDIDNKDFEQIIKSYHAQIDPNGPAFSLLNQMNMDIENNKKSK